MTGMPRLSIVRVGAFLCEIVLGNHTAHKKFVSKSLLVDGRSVVEIMLA